MKRRTFGAASATAALIGAKAAVLAGYASLTKSAEALEVTYRLGVLTLGGITAGGTRALTGELANRGYVEGKNLRVDFRDASTPEQLGTSAAELLRLKPDAMLSTGPEASLTLHAQTATVPIVTIGVSYPVQLGLAQNLRRPGGNITGVTMVVAGGFSGKMLQFLQEINPAARKIAVLSNSRSPIHPIALSDDVIPSAKRLALDLSLVSAETQADVPKAIDAAVRAKASALLVLPDALYNRPANFVPDLVASAKLPAIYFFRGSVAAGGLMCYGPYTDALFVDAAAQIDKIFRGESPAGIPFAQPTKFQLVINTKTAATLRLELPQSLLLRATELIS